MFKSLDRIENNIFFYSISGKKISSKYSSISDCVFYVITYYSDFNLIKRFSYYFDNIRVKLSAYSDTVIKFYVN